MYEENTFELYAYLFLGWALIKKPFSLKQLIIIIMKQLVKRAK